MKPQIIVFLFLFAAPLFLAFLYCREFLAVDSALDSGASYDYIAGKADYSQNHPYIPFTSRHTVLIVTSIASLIAALIYGFILKKNISLKKISNVHYEGKIS